MKHFARLSDWRAEAEARGLRIGNQCAGGFGISPCKEGEYDYTAHDHEGRSVGYCSCYELDGKWRRWAMLTDSPEECLEMDPEAHDEFRRIALVEAVHERYALNSDDDIEIDPGASVSESENGTWVAAWVWIADEDQS